MKTVTVELTLDQWGLPWVISSLEEYAKHIAKKHAGFMEVRAHDNIATSVAILKEIEEQARTQ